MSPNSRIQNQTFIRGLLLSTGEDYIRNSESVAARTILLRVPPEKNVEAGERCRNLKAEYRMFLPGLIQYVISKENWVTAFANFITAKTADYHSSQFSNGLRVAANWALNAVGFKMFVEYQNHIGVIDQSRVTAMLEEYDAVVKGHLQVHVESFRAENQVEVLFRVLAEKFATNSLHLLDDPNTSKGKTIGKKSETAVFLFPDTLIETLTTHYRSRGQKMPFGKDALRDALIQAGSLKRSSMDRWTRQVRAEVGRRVQAWEFDAEEFSSRCEIEYAVKPPAEEVPATVSISEEQVEKVTGDHDEKEGL
jgi:hypothetical protein